MKTIRLSKSCIGQAEKDAVMAVLDNEYLGMGQDVQKFEASLSKYFNRNVVCVNTGTAAIQLSLQSCEVGSGDEVLVQSLTYVATFQAIKATGATPVACDILEDSFTIDLKDAKRKISAKTKAIVPVHYTGGVGNLDEIYKFAKENNLVVIEDAAHAFGTIYQNKRIGSMGQISCFSFDGIKNITSGEGGCIVSDDPVVIQRVSDARLLGVEKDTTARYSGKRSWDFDVKYQGWRYHMSNIMAAIGIEQFNRFSEFAEKRQKFAKLYVQQLKDFEKISLLNINYDEVVPHIFVIRLLSADRDTIREKLMQKCIETGIHYKPNHMLTYFQTTPADQGGNDFPVTEKIYSQILTLPLHPDLIEEDIRYVCSSLKEILK